MSHIRYVFEDKSHLSVYRPMGQLLYMTEAEYDTDWLSYPHAHPFAELFYVREGSGIFNIDKNEIKVSEGDLLLINANVPHTEKNDGQHVFSYIVMGINAIAFQTKFVTHLNDSPYSFLKLKKQSVLQPILTEMLREANAKEPYYMDYCQAQYEQLMITIVRENEIDLTFKKKEDISATMASLKAYIEKNYQLDLTLDSMADRLHVNKFHLTHQFTREYGVPPIQYLINVRIKEARNLLENSDHSISNISQMCGFSSLSYFGQSFKRVTSLSAGEYRKQAKAKDN